MAAAQKAAGFTLGTADLLRRAMGKKDKDELDRQYQAAVQKAAAEALDKVRLNDLPFLQKELQRLQNGEALPSADEADTPIALKQLRDQYRQQSAALAP